MLQFIADWNRAEDREALIAEGACVRGLRSGSAAGDSRWLSMRWPTGQGWRCRIGSLEHRAPVDVILFGWKFDGEYGRSIRRRAPAVCAYHRVWIHPRMLDKGTPDWWRPWP